MIRRTLLGLLAFAAFVAILATSAVVMADTDLPWSVGDNGGGTATSTNYALGGTVGQPVAGLAESTNYALGAGYWAGIADADSDGILDDADPEDDGDGYTDVAEAAIGTSRSYPCGYGGWPSDLLSESLSANKLDVQDLISFVAPVRRLDTSPNQNPPSNYLARWDLAPGANPPFLNHISIFDITTLLNGVPGSPAYPPMFAGPRAFGKVCPLAAQ